MIAFDRSCSYVSVTATRGRGIVMASSLQPVGGLSNVERQQAILHVLQQRRRITVADICEAFGVSEATARRDLEALAHQGKVQRVRGGAILSQPAPPEPPLLVRAREQAEAKARIGRAAAALVQDGESVFLGSGTTVLEVAKHLQERKNLTVITNSLPVINLFAQQPDVTLISLGGMLRPSELSFIGHITEQALAEVRAEKVIIGTRGITLDGLTNDYLPETLTDRAILRVGRQVIIVADHTKLGVIASAFLAPLHVVDVLVTDTEADAEFVQALEERGVQVILA